jgi:hypothetical protein
MSNKQNIDRLRIHLIQARQLVEPYANNPGVQDHLVLLDNVIGPYIERAYAGEFEVTDPVLREVEIHLNLSRDAAARGSWDGLLDSNRVMISGLPGDPFTLP